MSKMILAVMISLICLSLTAQAQTIDSKKVEVYLMEAEAAGQWLAEGGENLARMEAALEPGFLEIKAMVASYKPDARTNAFLVKRGWGHLVWTQLMYRLLAIRNGVYERELDFAERVALESMSRDALATVDQSVDRIFTLLEAKEKFGLSKELDGFAQGLFMDGESGTDYQTVVTDFRDQFQDRRAVVIVRLESGSQPRIIDPASLPLGTTYAADYQHQQQRLRGDNRLDEVFGRLAGYDAERIYEIVGALEISDSPAERENLLNQARVELLMFEEVLVATERDPSVQAMLTLYKEQSHQAFNPFGGCDADFRSVMVMVHVAKWKLESHANPKALRELYQTAELVR